MIIILKNTVLCTYVIIDLNGEEIVATFYGSWFQKTSQKKFSIENVIKRKIGRLYITWKGYDSSFDRKNIDKYER